MELKVYNKTTNKSMIYSTKANLDLTNTLVVSALLKSINNVYKENFNAVSYI